MKGGEWNRERGRTAGLCGHGIEAMVTALAIHGFKSHRHRQVKGPDSPRKHWEVGAFVMPGEGLR